MAAVAQYLPSIEAFDADCVEEMRGIAEGEGVAFDDFAAPWSVCRPPRQSLSSNLSATVAMIVMLPALGVMEVAMLPALDPSFITYNLDSSFKHTTSRAAAQTR
jgi:hypothetical protein